MIYHRVFLLNLIMVLPFCVYFLQSEKNLLLYHGYSTDLEKRVLDHNNGGTILTSKRRPLTQINYPKK